jgi:hypothetical protein
MKPILEKLKIKLVFAVKYETQTNMFTGRAENTEVPAGEVHIFQVETVDSFTALAAYSMCSMERAQIGEQTKDTDKRPNGLPMCARCEAAWKNHPESPWQKWAKAEPLS